MNTIPSTPRNLLAAAIVSLLALIAAITTEAATITWGTATTISGDSDVSTAGTLVGAANLNRTGLAPTVNGVTFADWDSSVTTTSGIFSLDGLKPTTTWLLLTAPFTNLSAAYQDLGRSYAGGGPKTLTLSGLTAGETYAFQWWSIRTDGGDGTTTATAGNSVTLDQNTTNAFGGLGQFSIGTFIADNATQTVVFSGTGAGTTVIINAMQLRHLAPPVSAVPEPGSALVGAMVLGVCGLGSVRRRRA